VIDVTTLLPADFKNQFTRDFPYLLTWDNLTTYNSGKVVYYSLNGLFYQCLNNGTLSNPTIDNTNWAEYTDDVNNYVQDADITSAFAQAQQMFNSALFSSDQFIKLGYLYLTAHFMSLDLRTAFAGVQSRGENAVVSRGVGSINESYSIPQRFLDDPILSEYTKTGYGMKYLNMVLPQLTGNVSVAGGTTQP
jgi:Protein of unknown function (DUF4054)